MTSQPVDPYVVLTVPEDLREEAAALAFASSLRGDPVHTIHHALVGWRLMVIREMSQQLAKDPNSLNTEEKIRVFLSAIWQSRMVGFKQVLVPMIVAEYAAAARAARAGRVNQDVLNALADQHAERIGAYFNQTSAEAMLQGYTTYVNRKVPQRVALERVLDAYGLTPRQMSGMTSMKEPEAIQSSVPRDLKAKVKAYIGASIRQRFKIFSRQESHNLDAQASQVVWMYMVDKGLMSETAEKVWLTAKDERVCPICGPLHGRVVRVAEPFITEDGIKLWVPGAHVNCRCRVKVRQPLGNLPQPVQKDWDPTEHPRNATGQFGRTTPLRRKTMTRSVDEEFMALVQRTKEPARTPTTQELESMLSAEMESAGKQAHRVVAGTKVQATAKPVVAKPKVVIAPADLTVEVVAQRIDAITQTVAYTPTEMAVDNVKADQALSTVVGTKTEAETETRLFTFGQTRRQLVDEEFNLLAEVGPRGNDAHQRFTKDNVFYSGENAWTEVKLVAQENIVKEIARRVEEAFGSKDEITLYDQQAGTKANLTRDEYRTALSLIAFGTGTKNTSVKVNPVRWVDDDQDDLAVPRQVDLEPEQVARHIADLEDISQEDFRVTLYVADAQDLPEGQVHRTVKGYAFLDAEFATESTSDDPDNQEHGPSWLRIVSMKPDQSD